MSLCVAGNTRVTLQGLKAAIQGHVCVYVYVQVLGWRFRDPLKGAL